MGSTEKMPGHRRNTGVNKFARAYLRTTPALSLLRRLTRGGEARKRKGTAHGLPARSNGDP